MSTASDLPDHIAPEAGPRAFSRRLAGGWWLAVAGLGAAGGIWLLFLVADDESIGLSPEAFLAVAVAWSFIASGLIAASHGSAARLGRLMVYTGFAVLVGPLLQYAPSSLLVTLGIWVANAWMILFALFLLSFPRGRLESRRDRLLLAPFVVALIPLMLVWFLFWNPAEAPGNAFLIWDNAGIADAIDWAQRVILAGGALVLTGAVARRWYRASASLRRSLTPILVGAAASVLASVTVILDAVRGQSTRPLDYILLATLTAVPLAVLADMLRARLAHSAVGELVLELSADPVPEDLRDALARALHYPSLELAYWLPEFETYADRSGRRVEVRSEPGRTTTVVNRAGKPVAALLHDASLELEPALLDAVVAAAGIALENGRLESELRAHYLVSESLTNVAKHAEASTASIAVSREGERLVVEVQDDGVGGASTNGGSGPRGLEDRIEALGGRVKVWSPEGGGTRIRAEVPLGEREASLVADARSG